MAVARYTKEYKVNMGNYEHLVFGLNIQADNVNDYPDLTDEELVERVKEMVEAGLRDDIQAAAADTEKEDSFIHLHPANQPSK